MSRIKRTIKHVKRVAHKIKPRRLTKAEIYDKKRRKRLCAVLTVLGYILMFGSFYGFYKYKFDSSTRSLMDVIRPMSVAEREKAVLFLGSLIYRHEMGYSAYCQSKGYVMTRYPQTFQREFASEIKVLSGVLQKRGTDLNRFLPQIAQQAGPMVQQVIEIELQEFRKFIMASTQYQATKPDVDLTIADVCAIVDEHAETIMDKSASADFKKIRELAEKLD